LDLASRHRAVSGRIGCHRIEKWIAPSLKGSPTGKPDGLSLSKEKTDAID
jgi:hypothetical protein